MADYNKCVDDYGSKVEVKCSMPFQLSGNQPVAGLANCTDGADIINMLE